MVSFARVTASDYQRLLYTLGLLQRSLALKQPAGDYALSSDVADLQDQLSDARIETTNVQTNVDNLQQQVDGLVDFQTYPYTNTKSQYFNNFLLQPTTVSFPWSDYSSTPKDGSYTYSIKIKFNTGVLATTIQLANGTVNVDSNTYNSLVVSYKYFQRGKGTRSFTQSGTSLNLSYDGPAGYRHPQYLN